MGQRTEEAYYACVRQLSEFYGKSPDLLWPEDIRQYTSDSLQRVAIADCNFHCAGECGKHDIDLAEVRRSFPGAWKNRRR